MDRWIDPTAQWSTIVFDSSPLRLLLCVSSPAFRFANGTFACVTHSHFLIINKSMQMLPSLSPLSTTAVHNDLLFRWAHDAAEIDRHSLTQDGKPDLLIIFWVFSLYLLISLLLNMALWIFQESIFNKIKSFYSITNDSSKITATETTAITGYWRGSGEFILFRPL